jgi:predicted nuclease of predicted toxin-antitoxin system
MLILLDENLLSKKLKQPFIEAGHTVNNIDTLGWRGLSDRKILELASIYPFDVFITADKNLPFQQNLSSYAIRVALLDTSNTRPSHLLPLMVQLSVQLTLLFAENKIVKIDDAGAITAIGV